MGVVAHFIGSREAHRWAKRFDRRKGLRQVEFTLLREGARGFVAGLGFLLGSLLMILGSDDDFCRQVSGVWLRPRGE